MFCTLHANKWIKELNCPECERERELPSGRPTKEPSVLPLKVTITMSLMSTDDNVRDIVYQTTGVSSDVVNMGSFSENTGLELEWDDAGDFEVKLLDSVMDGKLFMSMYQALKGKAKEEMKKRYASL